MNSVLFILIQCLVISGMVCDLIVLIAVQTLDSFFFEAGNFLRRLLSPCISKKHTFLDFAAREAAAFY